MLCPGINHAEDCDFVELDKREQPEKCGSCKANDQQTRAAKVASWRTALEVSDTQLAEEKKKKNEELERRK